MTTATDLPAVLDKLHEVDQESHDIDANRAALIREARASGATWTQVGEALGMSKQAAWERFRQLDPAKPQEAS